MMGPEDKTLLLNRINKKGIEVAHRLAALKAGQDVRMEDFPHALQIGAGLRDKEARIRSFLLAINQARDRLQNDQLEFCSACGKRMEIEGLFEMPWGLDCPACAGASS